MIDRTGLHQAIRRRVAVSWQRGYRVWFQLLEWRRRFRSVVLAVLVLVLMALSIVLVPTIQGGVEGYYQTEGATDALRNLILSTGTALIGATAIVTSLVLFAMQVNIERMPYGLFRRLAADIKLLASFTFAFLLAIAVAALSTLLEVGHVVPVMVVTVWGVVFILLLFLFAYRRALSLVNPLKQLDILVDVTRRDLRAWAQIGRRLKPLAEPEEENDGAAVAHDLGLMTFFQVNPHWADRAKQSIQHAMSFSSNYAQRGDYEVSNAALRAVVQINATYVATKGKTFYSNELFIDNPLSTDSFINSTLEHLRKNARSGIAREDEQQIEQALRAMAALVGVYLGIDYTNPNATKSHVQLAAGYLSNAVEAVIPHDMADVLMEGQRLMGQSARHMLAHGEPDDIAALSGKIAGVACIGFAKEAYRPVTLAGMEQLAQLTFELLRDNRHHDIRFAAQNVRRNVASVSMTVLGVADTPLANNHGTYLAPYYSSTGFDSFRAWLTELANSVGRAEADNVDAQRVIRNIERWADGLFQTEKELLVATIEKRSHFAFDVIHWITGITDILLAVSNAPACGADNSENLRRHARLLVATLTWIPDDKESVTFVETFGFTDKLFEVAMCAHNRGCNDIAEESWRFFMSWMLKGGKYDTGWGGLERGVCGLAIFAVAVGDDLVSELRVSMAKHLSDQTIPAQKIRDRAARGILERAHDLSRAGRLTSPIDAAMVNSDHEKLRSTLQEMARLLLGGDR